MSISRRTVLLSALASTAAGGLAAAGTTTATAAQAAPAASAPGDVVGKITVGYQGWFACPGDGAPINSWWHWSANGGQPPSPSNTTLTSWPDMRDYQHTYPTAYANLGTGQPATLFSSWDDQTVDTHFRWMAENGCDTAALQRFDPVGGEGPTRDGMAQKVRTAAEAHGVKFYVMYDVTQWTNMQSEIKTDWTNKMKAHTASAAYARQNGMPVVCVWGFGFSDDHRDFTAPACLDVVNWFKSQGCYVIGGVPTHWRAGTDDSRPGFADVYHAFHMISPWMVGRISTVADADNFLANLNTGDLADCRAHGIDYQPCVIPGNLQAGDRAHGDLMWRQFYNLTKLGVQGFYISMFDEFNEGNQIAKTAETAADVPAGSGFLALDEDGTACSADYYLRLTNDGGRMLKQQIALTPNRPTPPVPGGTGPTGPTGDLALRRAASASSTTQAYSASNAVDGNASTYWESANNAFPQWWQVDLGSAQPVKRLVLTLPPDAAWASRTQTVAVLGSADGRTFTTLSAAAGRAFDPATGNSVTVSLASAATTRYVRLQFTANTGWPAGQLSGVSVFSS
ncbi:discoidin domain-containing protein [Streptomyces sp. 8L]|uniref:discoidin domain-containing protein n=1 Tax=Streptomyces sp. 8L TaxID=2877242 RepID=UPI001CD3A445|nr:discoidin domain-containing protein [Streptomyces sp. 8L]MCA1219457.1 discoidin domain-containing protein [Streptomyces sp. 8L]